MSWKFHTGPSYLLQSILVVIAVLVQPGCGIQCFVCDSSVNPGCANLRSNSSIVPETCTLDKMKTINTWLFELNEISYFESELYSIPTMFCQKVVAKRTPDSEPITARFCQLDTRETNACSILKDKLQDASKGNKQDSLIHCSICSTDRCNGSGRASLITALGYLLIAGFVKLIG